MSTKYVLVFWVKEEVDEKCLGESWSPRHKKERGPMYLNTYLRPGMAAYAFNPSTEGREQRQGRSLSPRSAWFT